MPTCSQPAQRRMRREIGRAHVRCRRHVAEARTYLVEYYRPSSTAADLERVASRVREAVDAARTRGPARALSTLDHRGDGRVVPLRRRGCIRGRRAHGVRPGQRDIRADLGGAHGTVVNFNVSRKEIDNGANARLPPFPHRDRSARLILAGAVSGAGQHSLAQAQAAGWDCDPLILIGGHYHCSPPGKPGVLDIIDGTATSPSIVHQVFRPDGTFAGAETPDPRRPVRRAALPDRPVATGPSVAAHTDVLRLPPLRVHPVVGAPEESRRRGSAASASYRTRSSPAGSTGFYALGPSSRHNACSGRAVG